MKPAVKPLLYLGCATGTTCSIVIPVALQLNRGDEKNHTIANDLASDEDSVQGPNGLILPPPSIAGRNHILGNEDDHIDIEGQTFERLWDKVHLNYKSAQVEGNTLNTSSLKNQLNKTLEAMGATELNVWKLEAQDWRNCKGNQVHSTTFCGYLEIKNESHRFKIKITSELENWKLTVVRKKDNDSEIFLEASQTWTPLKDIEFNNLTTFRNTDEGGWKKLNLN
ncbi:hypothetical protein [Candidatus Mycoplasma haematominutum]|uniref:Uncharacterized protein n=1 Tax=Candidatus Mycoplasma haematominutum 'Birmingham 1' TaxID=1116213 RepID=G8C2R8_9MOLU|nr:hypothetical protein [Candidatus Mycoplasma haematominutum]CCE66616.1 hypothetical protein MHM_00980 [Candidatus Mycoplasma haematominutum 'Birmingham 1']